MVNVSLNDPGPHRAAGRATGRTAPSSAPGLAGPVRTRGSGTAPSRPIEAARVGCVRAVRGPVDARLHDVPARLMSAAVLLT